MGGRAGFPFHLSIFPPKYTQHHSTKQHDLSRVVFDKCLRVLQWLKVHCFVWEASLLDVAQPVCWGQKSIDIKVVIDHFLPLEKDGTSAVLKVQEGGRRQKALQGLRPAASRALKISPCGAKPVHIGLL